MLKHLSLFACIGFILTSCAIAPHSGFDSKRAQEIEDSVIVRQAALTPELENKILALDPEHVSEREVTEVLSNAPAPRVINIHGGVLPFELAMKSFSKFMIGVGYPEWSVRNPWNGAHSYSCYQSSREMAGMIVWFREHEGLRPMMLGHSVGGMQVVKVLHDLEKRIPAERVWNPLTRKWETQPAAVANTPPLCFASSLGAGGLARTLPSQWSMNGRLRKIPDSVEEFTGYYIGMDIWGGDNFGFGSANLFHSAGKAVVRNVRMPTGSSHATIPDTERFLKDPAALEWINNYSPGAPQPKQEDAHVLWVADVWHSIKKHWVLELQEMIHAKREQAVHAKRAQAQSATDEH